MAKQVSDKADAKQSLLVTVQSNVADLPTPDAELVQRWMAEAGQERFIRLIAALAAPKRGRHTLLEQRMPLLMEMAAQIHRTRCAPYAAATKVSTGEVATQLPREAKAQPDALRLWLMRYWKEHGMRLMNAAARDEQQANAQRSVKINAFDAYRLASTLDIETVMPGYRASLEIFKGLPPGMLILKQAMRSNHPASAALQVLQRILANPYQK